MGGVKPHPDMSFVANLGNSGIVIAEAAKQCSFLFV